MTEKVSAPKDHKLVKASQTMTAGKSHTTIGQGQAITLHGEVVSVIVTDPQETIVQYGNGAQRTFHTNDLAGYLELGTFPYSTLFTRPVEGGMEKAYVEHSTTDSYVMQVIGADGIEPTDLTSMTYAELIAWHMAGPQQPAERTLPGKLYAPKLSAAQHAEMERVADEEVDKLADALEAMDDDQPFETDLKKRIEQLEAELAAAEVAGQQRINDLTSENFKLKQAIQQQVMTHATIRAGYEEDLARLEAKAAIINPSPACKEVCTLVQRLRNPEERVFSDTQLAEKLSEGWSPLDISYSFDETTWRYVTLVRDLPASPAPKVAVTDAAIYSAPFTPAARPPVTPPMPANQSFVGFDAAKPVVSRPLTHNGPKPGETKRIPTLASIEARRERDAAEIDTILQRGRDTQEALRRQFATQPSPFPSTGG